MIGMPSMMMPGVLAAGARPMEYNAFELASRGAGNAPMSPAVASILSSGVSAALPYLIQGGANLFDQITGAGEEDGRRIADNEKMFSELQSQRDSLRDEAIRRAKATAGQAMGTQLAASGAAGLSSFNPVLAAQARQGEAQMAGRISGLELAKNQDRADYEASRVAAINNQLNNMGGSAVRRRNARRSYETAVG